MKKVITYGTYDFLHYGHIKLLERAKALGDYLIVGVTSEVYDMSRGKINVTQSLMERIEAVKQTGLADEIIVEEYEGQKIDDIQRYNVDVFAIGSDWETHFDYLKEYCEVVYLNRTQGISSSEIRTAKQIIRIGFIGSYHSITRYADEVKYINGLEISAFCCTDNIEDCIVNRYYKNVQFVDNYDKLIELSDAIYIVSHPSVHYSHVKEAISAKKHVLCESPMTLSVSQFNELCNIAEENKVVLMDSIKTAFSTAYNRLILLIKGGEIGKVVSVDSTCTSQSDINYIQTNKTENIWNSICSWGPTALLPIYHILGSEYRQKQIISSFFDKQSKFDRFTKISFIYDTAVASIKVGKGIKSEGELLILGTKGYIYVPAPWWKTDYFEVRYEDQSKNKRYFYKLDGDGIRYELVCFVKAIVSGKKNTYLSKEISKEIINDIEDFYNDRNLVEII